MIFKHLLNSSIVGLKTHKTRSALTILGIVIGITSVILIVSIGRGAEDLILKEIGGMGADMIVIRPGKEPTGPTDLADTLFADSLKKSDIEALKKKSNAPELASIGPAVIVSGTVSYRGETYRPQMFGWVAKFMGSIFNVYPEEGVLFNENDIKRRASVVVIGHKVKEELFGMSDALGKNIKIKGRNFRVVGIFPKKGQVAFLNIDEVVIMPYTTAQSYLLGIDYFNEVMVKASSAKEVPRTVKDIELTLRGTHNITGSEKDDFYVVTQQALVDQVKNILGILTAFLSSVVAISLLVAGIGVMNIMLVSVTERTREIGLRKALGATNRDISTQFILEAVMLTGVGGLIGVLLGALLSFLISFGATNFAGLNWPFTFPLGAALLGLGMSSFVGLIFGIYPAKQAAKKSPIEALRYE